MAKSIPTIDHGGNHLIVKSITLADAPGQDPSGDASLALGTLTVPSQSGAVVVAGGAAATAGATHVIEIDIGGTPYFILLTNANA